MGIQTPHDALFRQTFANLEQAGSLLRAALPAEVVRRADWSTLRLHEGTAFDVLDERRTDLLFSLTVGGVETYVWVLLEHQSSQNRWMAVRLLDYLLAVWRRELDKKPRPRTLPVVIPVVVHHGRQRWRAPTWFGDLFDPSQRRASELATFVPDFEYRVFDLARTSDEMLARSVDAPRGRLVLAALKHAAYEGPDARWLDGWIALTARAIVDAHGHTVLEILVRYVLEVSDTPRERIHDVLSSVLDAEEVERVMTTAEKLRQEGREEGRLEGRRLGRVETLLRLLTLRFEELPDSVKARVQAASFAELDAWAERVLEAKTLDDVFG